MIVSEDLDHLIIQHFLYNVSPQFNIWTFIQKETSSKKAWNRVRESHFRDENWNE